MKINEALKSGASFGLTSGIITTLGLMVGLSAGTESRLAVIGGVFTIAFADAFSDSLGMHISKESENHHTTAEIWEATFATFVTKLVVASTFAVPVIYLSLPTALAVSVAWGMLLLTLLSLYLAKQSGVAAWKVVTEHLSVAIVVVIASGVIGSWIRNNFK